MREMKNSGVEWIGEMPGEWIRTSLLNVLSTKISDGPHETPILLDKGIPFISVDSLNNSESIDFSVVKKFISEEDYLRYYKKASLTKGDILFSKAATIGKTAIVGDEKFMVWSPIAIIKTNMSRCNNKYIYYILNCSGLIKQISLMGSHNTQINVGMRELEKVQIPVPSLPEQHRIADFLDEKCAKIDAVIEKQKQVIEKLKEYKLSVITEAVTKGLDPTVPMKDSGVEWIGEIPEGWSLRKIKSLTKIISKGTTPSTIGKDLVDNGDVRFIKCENICEGKILNDPAFYIDDETNEILKRSQLNNNDILFVIAGATIGKTAIVTNNSLPANTNQAVCFIRLKNESSVRFVWYYLQSNIVKTMLNILSVQSAQPNLSMSDLGNFYVPYPDVKEQIEVSNYLDKKCGEIDSAIAKKQSIVEKLTEYKKSLIYEVVTGKREV